MSIHRKAIGSPKYIQQNSIRHERRSDGNPMELQWKSIRTLLKIDRKSKGNSLGTKWNSIGHHSILKINTNFIEHLMEMQQKFIGNQTEFDRTYKHTGNPKEIHWKSIVKLMVFNGFPLMSYGFPLDFFLFRIDYLMEFVVLNCPSYLVSSALVSNIILISSGFPLMSYRVPCYIIPMDWRPVGNPMELQWKSIRTLVKI